MNVAASIEAFLAHRRDKGVSRATMELYRHWFGLWLTWRAGRPADLAAVDANELRAFSVT